MYIPRVPEYDYENYSSVGYSELFNVNRTSPGLENFYEDKRAVEIGFDDANKIYYVEIPAGFKMYAGTSGADKMYMHKRIPEEYAWYGGLEVATNYSEDSCPGEELGTCRYAFKLRKKSRFILLSEPYNLYQLYYLIQDQETRDRLSNAFLGLKRITDFSFFINVLDPRNRLENFPDAMDIAREDGIVDIFTDSNASPDKVSEYPILRYSETTNDDLLIKSIYPLMKKMGYQGYVGFNMKNFRVDDYGGWQTFHEEILVINPKELLERDFRDPKDFSNSSEEERMAILKDRKDYVPEISDHSVWTLLYVEKLLNRYGSRWKIDDDSRQVVALAALVHEGDINDITRMASGLGVSLTKKMVSTIECVQKNYRLLERYVRQVSKNFDRYIIIETKEYSNENQEEFYIPCPEALVARRKPQPAEDEVCVSQKVYKTKPTIDNKYSIVKKNQIRPLTYLVKDTPNCDYYLHDKVKQKCLEDARREVKISRGPDFDSLKVEYLKEVSTLCQDEMSMKAILLVSMASTIGLVPYGAGHINQGRIDIEKNQVRSYMAFSTTFPQIKNRFLTDLVPEHYDRSREMRKVGLVVSELMIESITSRAAASSQ